MRFWEKRRERKSEALGNSLLAILKKEHKSYENRMYWQYFAEKQGLIKDENKWFPNAKKIYFSIVSSMWKRGFPICVDDGKCWYPTGWKDAEPCLYEINHLLRMENSRKKLEALSRIGSVKYLSHFLSAASFRSCQAIASSLSIS